ncbi:nucleotidyltransferase [uncultured Clostridium sp.]|uniref:nucleotidyltransferase n=1 Tax=uncultured Clostridium sp. TaxID=59620 RepID=UPI0025E11178|nr:nucleotidyltransferase [uncultured Clostridium sp.]
MNITGIITEYNPFHNGHKFHLEESKKQTKSDGTICIMSGNFVQRGGPAIIDKWKRTEMALNNGVDLIIELPTFYAVSSAEFFAKGAVSILNSLNIVNNLFFGSEIGDAKALSEIAKVLVSEDERFQNILKENLSLGLTFAKAREKSLIEYLNRSEINNIITSSNNILGIEYIKAILKLNSSINPVALKREGSNYNDKSLSQTFSSATSIREVLKNTSNIEDLKNIIPLESYEVFSKLQEQDYRFTFEEEMFKYIKYKIQTNCVNFNNLYEVTEGLDNKIIKEISSSNSLHEFILKIKSKRYTYSKISRILTHIYLGLDNDDFKDIANENNLYVRVLGFNKTGREILSLIKANSSIPLITKVPRFTNNPLLKFDLQATACYSLLNDKVNPFNDYLQSPIIKY